MATGGDDWLDLPNVWPDLTSAPLIGEASVIAAVAAAFRARARNREQQDRCDYKTRAGRSLLLFKSGGWALARILVIAGPAVLALASFVIMFIRLWN